MTTLARQVVELLGRRGLTVGTAESLTGGLLCSTLIDVPGASSVVRGGAVAYATDVKASVLGVDADLLAARGAVDADVARGMAAGARRLLGVDIGVATTGVAGPDRSDGQPVGTVFVALDSDAGSDVLALALSGDRRTIRETRRKSSPRPSPDSPTMRSPPSPKGWFGNGGGGGWWAGGIREW